MLYHVYIVGQKYSTHCFVSWSEAVAIVKAHERQGYIAYFVPAM